VKGPILLAVGNLIALKGHGLAIEALAQLEQGTLLIAGDGPERSRLEAQVARLGLEDRVRMLGSVPHALTPALFAAADVTLHPSLVEGFANARLESLACGTPVVTTSTGGAAELIDRVEAGRIVDAEPAAIAAAVREILRAPPPDERVRAAAAPFSWERNAAELEAHLRRLAPVRAEG
jgi:glycosyltransferase involved in cell wall biosynthesis